jgi:DNA gyrase inhibitor GyrI
MSKDEKEGFMRRLLSWREDMTLRNIKFCRGDRDVISEEEFRAAVCSVVEQSKTAQRSTAPTSSEVITVDVRKLVANM